MLSDIAQYNLDKDKNVLGKDWLLTYGGYFSDEENIAMFIKSVESFLPDRELNILYVASASGLLGERLIENLDRGKLTIVDISQKHLAENKNPQTKKICADLLSLDLGQKFDLILMRSSLDYFPSRDLQVKVLKNIKNHLKPEGIFINQPAYVPNTEDRDILSRAYNITDKIGQRFFQSTDIGEIYKEAGFEEPKRIGEGKLMVLTEEDQIERYGLEGNDIKEIQTVLKKAQNSGQVTESGYTLRFEFPIFLSR
ncbi:MAG: class I SAM-dependent methyltransferase [Candidatus Paceibacterota bacterium]|jgi:SAM-dependent methyltransferase